MPHCYCYNQELKFLTLTLIFISLFQSTELFLIKSVTLVVSDRAEKFGQKSSDKGKWGYGSGTSGGPPSLNSVEVPTPIATPPTPFSAEYPLSNSTNIRGQAAQRTVRNHFENQAKLPKVQSKINKNLFKDLQKICKKFIKMYSKINNFFFFH